MIKRINQEFFYCFFMCVVLAFPTSAWASEEVHNQKGEAAHEHEEEAVLKLSKEQIQEAGITTQEIQPTKVSRRIQALGEVRLNQYRTVRVSPILTTRVEKRFVTLGDRVEKGDLLVRLHTIEGTDVTANRLSTADLEASAAELAAEIEQVKGELAIATANWNRIKALGPEAVSGKRYKEAKLAKEQAEARLKAYGQSQLDLRQQLESSKEVLLDHFDLRAEQSGTIIEDDFVLGQIVTPEDTLFVISDLDRLWVEANVKPEEVTRLSQGTKAVIQVNGHSLEGHVINLGRTIDETTRTLPVRIEVESERGSLFPGQFVKTVLFENEKDGPVILVPAESVLKGTDGDWVLFEERVPGEFVPREVEIIEDLGDQLIISGIENGTIIVTKGAFTVQSEFAKGSFEVHNH